MIKSGIYILTLLLFHAFAFAQQKVMVFSNSAGDLAEANQAAIEALTANAARYQVELTFTTQPSDFNTEKLGGFHAVMFLNSSANLLDFRQSSVLLRFFKAGGGFLGIHKAAESSYNWLWYQKLINAGLKSVQPETPAQYDIITNAFIGKINLPPLWKLNDQPLLFENTGIESKPVLIDLGGRVCSWYGFSGLGNKTFYTSFGGTPQAFKTQAFIDHIFSGLQEISSSKLPDFASSVMDEIPEDKHFGIYQVLEQLSDPVAIKINPKKQMFILFSDGRLSVYDLEYKSLTELGSFPVLKGHIDFSFDPEFETNGYIYFYGQPVDGSVAIKRMKMSDNKSFEIIDFGTQATPGMTGKAVYHPELYESSAVRLPVYYQNKTFRYDDYKGILAETRGGGGELLNVEPFLTSKKINKIKDLEIGLNGELYLLETDGVRKVVYAPDGVFPPVARASADVQKGSVPLKVSFKADQSHDLQNQALSYKWRFSEKDSSSVQNPVFIFRKPGVSKVTLEVKNASGQTDAVLLNIETEPLKKKK
ncbi:hypothetical protein GVN16_07930 [Emticicia sp. CRIBPO]|uniref:ThuA domain-containing protein n=1 Tax=Emticicia sp. CRIBPO TaxID=2683258 RepID=UPI001412895E|nr:ThuA domain-containing protein [Emticicia sp. CRIBPO]NBA85682.1 hypothetical protein [Emticicia sp. CRIBPO]